MLLSDNEIIIHAGNYTQFIDPVVDGEVKRCGTVPRPAAYPPGCYRGSRAVTLPLIPAGEQSGRIADQIADKYRQSDIRLRGNAGQPIPSRDQDGKGYCWAHSGTSAMLLARARDGQPYADLSAYSVAVVIKNGKDEGGWGAQGVDWMREHGCATSATWPQQSMSLANNTPAMQAEAGRYKIDEGWWDLSAPQYDRQLTWDQLVTCLLLCVPCVVDYNWWSHSVCAADVVSGTSLYRRVRGAAGKLALGKEFNAMLGMDHPVTQGLAIRIWNSWGDSWSEKGMGLLTGSQAVPDGAVGVRSVTATTA